MTFGLRRIAAGAVAGLLVFTLGACGKDKKDNASDTATTGSNTSSTVGSTSSSSAALAPNTIQVKGFAFSPDTLTVKAGATVNVTNADTAPHTVTSDDAKFDSGNVAGGASGTFTAPTTPGTYKYHCNIHARMEHKTLVVT